jgi:hypothetical protein
VLNIHFNSYSIQNVKVPLSPYLIKHRATKTYGRVEVQLNGFLALALEAEQHASGTGSFTPGKKIPVHIEQEAGLAPEWDLTLY